MAAPLKRCFAQAACIIRTSAEYHCRQPAMCNIKLQTHENPQLQINKLNLFVKRYFHASSVTQIFRNTEFDEVNMGIKMRSSKWNKYNTVVYPPTEEEHPIRPAEICHSRFNIKYSPKKMWYIATMIRGMSVDEAMKQLKFHKRKGGQSVLEVLEEAQEMAVRDHNVEYKSNLWICDSFVGKGVVVKGLRKHRGPRFGIVHYRYCHYFVRLREGKPPKYYYAPPKTGFEKMEEYIQKHRQKKILLGL
ncbi:39S ribosomal protein L22, mitochondrial-like [Pomacea canaliculata]|uniref:39S ribosomal protein L22, mitochondrial-like n=1 Tax=Pomacea canaliculata TaxID=400727 RepID=UPI000D72B418|nr:39S ribosomal protein L22, mitochondrial-like [Pomacea canaliculata]